MTKEHWVAGHGVYELRQCIDVCAEHGGAPACLTPGLARSMFAEPAVNEHVAVATPDEHVGRGAF